MPDKKNSKFLSYILRHCPESIGLSLNTEGWANIEELIVLSNKHGILITKDLIEKIVESSDKKRFLISNDNLYIKAYQGHTNKKVNISYSLTYPPKVLHHGTAERFMDSILSSGLIPKERHHVHLTEDPDLAIENGKRYGKPILLTICAREMQKDGYNFYLSENAVWLTDKVPSRYIIKIS